MSGMHIGRRAPFGLLDVKDGLNIDMFESLKARAEFAIRCTWPELESAQSVAWLRELADQLEIEYELPTAPGQTAARELLAERLRQVSEEGWTREHDDSHGDDSMSVAAACYALGHTPVAQLPAGVDMLKLWRWTGWATSWFKPKDKRRNLVRAGALILAEIERLDRAAARAKT